MKNENFFMFFCIIYNNKIFYFIKWLKEQDRMLLLLEQ